MSLNLNLNWKLYCLLKKRICNELKFFGLHNFCVSFTLRCFKFSHRWAGPHDQVTANYSIGIGKILLCIKGTTCYNGVFITAILLDTCFTSSRLSQFKAISSMF